MNKRGWLIPIVIVALNVLAIMIRWGFLPEVLPAHFNLQGNAGGTMPRNALLLYPLIAAAICLVAYMVAHVKRVLKTGMIILASGFCLVLLLSTMVSLTSGKVPFFMLAESVVLLIAVVAAIVSVIRLHSQLKRELH